MAATETLIRPQQPDIQYTPDIQKWRSRTQRRQQSEPESLSRGLPAGFPQKLQSDLVWEGSQIKDVYDWTHVLNEAELEEIEKALEHFKCERKFFGFCYLDLFLFGYPFSLPVYIY